MEIDFLEKSRIYIQEGQFEKAQVLLRRVLHETPDSAKALEISGDLAQRMGKRNEALAQYEQAGTRYADNDRLLESIICFEKAARLEHTNSDRYERLAKLYRKAGLPNQGIQKMIELCSRSIEDKDETNFVAGLRRIVELQPRNLRLGLVYVRVLRSMNRAGQAEEELIRLRDAAVQMNEHGILEEIKKLLPQTDGGEEELDPKSRVELGNLLYEIGSKDEALVELNRAVSDLLEQGEQVEAVNVLNRILEIDPGNTGALDKLRELQGEAAVPAGEEIVPEALVTEETVDAMAEPEPAPAEEAADTTAAEEPASFETEDAVPMVEEPAQAGADIFDDLIREVETYVDRVQQDRPEEPLTDEVEEPQSLEGQIADIEFLLKEMESPVAPTFEVAAEFDEFRGHIVWEQEDVAKRLELARQAYAAELYDMAFNHANELRINKNTWPASLELTGAAMIKLGKYGDAIKTVGPAILLEDIRPGDKIELRYLLAAAYEGLGDFENALRELEHIISIDVNYKDVREMYELLGGKKIPHQTAPVSDEGPVIELEREPVEFESVRYTEPVEPRPEPQRKSPAPEPPPKGPGPEPAEQEETEEPFEERGENISFL
ncbi:hypothetical protein IBX73_06675 [candidate division WOR-3 bacterium]|nr:hypothetical protein [candidate division WOR-3 bacterium]